MATEKAECKCRYCEQPYVVRVERIKRVDAQHIAEAFASAQGLCLDCWQKQQTRYQTERATASSLPDLEGRSQAQVRKALLMRDRYHTTHKAEISFVQNVKEDFGIGIPDGDAEQSQTVRADVLRELYESVGLYKAYACCFISDAGDVIKALSAKSTEAAVSVTELLQEIVLRPVSDSPCSLPVGLE